MSTDLDTSTSKHQRPAWRQRLVDAESGLREGIRADSTLFAFAFCAATILLTSVVLGLERWEWAILILSLGFAFSAEILHQVLKHLANRFQKELDDVVLMGATAIMVAHITAALVSIILLWPHFASIWTG